MTEIVDTAADPEPGHPLNSWPRPLAFVLSGGGAFGSVQVGMLRALARHGIHPDLVVGSSVGSLNGAIIAADPVAAPDRLADLWTTMSRDQVFGHGLLGAVRNLAVRRTLSSFDQLSSLIDQHLTADHFDDLSVPLGAVATDAAIGEPEILRTGPLKPALLASAAIPGVFPAVTIDGRPYVDGGVSANLPIRQAIAFGARSVIALDAAPLPAPAAPRKLIGTPFHVATLMVRNQRAHAIDDLVGRYPILVLPSVTPHDIGSFNFHRTAELIDRAQQAAETALASSTSVPTR